jgi:hypothetical protein
MQIKLWIRIRNSPVRHGVRFCLSLRRELVAFMRAASTPTPAVCDLARAISVFQAGECALDIMNQQETEEPIFLLSTGWRAGSTLLQRILVTDPALLLWGEPLGEMALLTRLTEMVSHSISEENLVEWKNQPSPTSSTLATSWIANLYPCAESFRLGLRSLFDQWMGQPARKYGFKRWGFKEVRLAASDALLLHWLYPRAKFLVISRHPYACYQSLVDSGWKKVYGRYPDIPVDSATSFARHWNRIAVSWSQLPVNFPVRKITYEDMVTHHVDWRELENWLGITIHENIALSSSVGRTAKRASLNWYERLIVSRVAAPGMRALGYQV